MGIPVDFDYQPVFMAVKIDNILSKWFLPIDSRVLVKRHGPEGVPEKFFWRGGIVAQLPG